MPVAILQRNALWRCRIVVVWSAASRTALSHTKTLSSVLFFWTFYSHWDPLKDWRTVISRHKGSLVHHEALTLLVFETEPLHKQYSKFCSRGSGWTLESVNFSKFKIYYLIGILSNVNEKTRLYFSHNTNFDSYCFKKQTHLKF